MDYQKKYRLLIGGAVLFLLLAYLLAFSKTWTAYQTANQLEQRLSNAGQAWQEIEEYQRRLDQLETQQSGSSFTPNQLFQHVAAFCQDHHLAIQAMPASTVYQQQDVEILHNPIHVQGAFIPMVKLLYDLERTQHLGRVVSVEFALERNYQSRLEELTAKIHLQNVQNNAQR